MTLKLPLAAVVSLLQRRQEQGPPEALGRARRAPKITRDRIVILRDGEPQRARRHARRGRRRGQDDPVQARRRGAHRPGLPRARARPGLLAPRSVAGDADLQGDRPRRQHALRRQARLRRTTRVNVADDRSAPRCRFKTRALARLDFNLGKLTFLSDLEPAKVVEKSGIGLVSALPQGRQPRRRADPARQAATPRACRCTPTPSWSTTSAASTRTSRAMLGVDARIGADSQALVTIYCDGEKRFSEVDHAPRRSRPVAINVKDVHDAEDRGQLRATSSTCTTT